MRCAEAGVATQRVATQGDACLQQEMLLVSLGGDVAVAVEGSRWLSRGDDGAGYGGRPARGVCTCSGCGAVGG